MMNLLTSGFVNGILFFSSWVKLKKIIRELIKEPIIWKEFIPNYSTYSSAW